MTNNFEVQKNNSVVFILLKWLICDITQHGEHGVTQEKTWEYKGKQENRKKCEGPLVNMVNYWEHKST